MNFGDDEDDDGLPVTGELRRGDATNPDELAREKEGKALREQAERERDNQERARRERE